MLEVIFRKAVKSTRHRFFNVLNGPKMSPLEVRFDLQKQKIITGGQVGAVGRVWKRCNIFFAKNSRTDKKVWEGTLS